MPYTRVGPSRKEAEAYKRKCIETVLFVYPASSKLGSSRVSTR